MNLGPDSRVVADEGNTEVSQLAAEGEMVWVADEREAEKKRLEDEMMDPESLI